MGQEGTEWHTRQAEQKAGCRTGEKNQGNNAVCFVVVGFELEILESVMCKSVNSDILACLENIKHTYSWKEIKALQ